MSQNAYSDEVFEIEPAAGRVWNWHVPVWLFAGLALLVVELKAKPALGVLIFCIQFGFNDWRTASWLCRTDTFPVRAKTIWWFLVGSGFLKIFVMAMLVYPMLCFLCALFGIKPKPGEVKASIAFGMIGILMSLVVTHIGAILANRRGVKVWINRQLHEARNRNEWPPQLRLPNRLRSIIEVTSLPAIAAAMFGLLFLIVGSFARQLAMAMVGSLIAVVSAVILINHRVLLRRITARSPDECWQTWQPPTPNKSIRPSEDDLFQ